MSDTAWYKVYNRQKNSSMGQLVGDKPILAVNAEAACRKMKAKHPHLRLNRLFAKPVAAEVVEREKAEANKTKVEVEVSGLEEVAP